MTTINEIEFAQVKALITENGHATRATVAERLSWAPGRVIAWIKRSPAYNGYAIGPAEADAISYICRNGIGATFAGYIANEETVS